MSTSPLLRSLQSLVRHGRVLSSPAQLAGYDADALGYKRFRPDAVVIPADVSELIHLLQHTASLEVPVTVRGAGTSLSGGPVAAQGGVIIHTSALRKIRQINSPGQWCEVECSVVLDQLDRALAPHGLFYPPDPSSGPVCTLGGNVAMNAGGAHCFRYGVTSNYVLGVEAVLTDGSVHRFGGPDGGRSGLREDWKRLMVGSEGTLAAFTRFWLRVLPRPQKCWTFRATFADLKSAEIAVQSLALHSSFPVAIELMDPRCVAMVENSPMAVGLPQDAFLIVTEIDGPAELVNARAPVVADLLRNSGAVSVQYSDDDAERQKLWKARKVAGGLMGQLSPDFLVQDAVIPRRALSDLLQFVYDQADAAGLRAVNVFHAGDGNLHPNFLFNSRNPGELEQVEQISKALMRRVVEVGGTLSGEHGIGNDKTSCMPLIFSGDALRLQLAVPRIFNPQHQLNPLKVFASRRFRSRNEMVPSASAGSEVDAATIPHTHQNRGAFQHFLDEIDGVICCSANTTGAELQSRAAAAGFRFPLTLAPSAPLAAHLDASPWGMASSRFGPLCDNVIGMNWRTPSGRIIRLGERVVKSTTGYDLLRFLMHSQGRFGAPQDLVLRLRPDTGSGMVLVAEGAELSLQNAARTIRSSSWIHWIDAIDLESDGKKWQPLLRLNVNCPPQELPVFHAAITGILAGEQLGPPQPAAATDPADLPDLVLRAAPDVASRIPSLICGPDCRLIRLMSGPGVTMIWFTSTMESSEQVTQRILHSVQQQLGEDPVDWFSRHHQPSIDPREADWISELQKELL